VKKNKIELHSIGGKKNKTMVEMNIGVDQIKPVRGVEGRMMMMVVTKTTTI
jgi:hypothetical protein